MRSFLENCFEFKFLMFEKLETFHHHIISNYGAVEKEKKKS